MVDTSLAVVQLLKLIALLFPVVALLLQLQHRAVDSVELKNLGLVAGMSLLALLSLSFLQLSLYLLSTQSPPVLLAFPLLAIAFISLMLPVLVVFSSERITEEMKAILSMVRVEISSVRAAKGPNSTTGEADDTEE